VKRRKFITLVVGTAGWPLAARAKQSARIRKVACVREITSSFPQTCCTLPRIEARDPRCSSARATRRRHKKVWCSDPRWTDGYRKLSYLRSPHQYSWRACLPPEPNVRSGSNSGLRRRLIDVRSCPNSRHAANATCRFCANRRYLKIDLITRQPSRKHGGGYCGIASTTKARPLVF
jgi:hypothetical protein